MFLTWNYILKKKINEAVIAFCLSMHIYNDLYNMSLSTVRFNLELLF